jgi:signal transduction histidine kinase
MRFFNTIFVLLFLYTIAALIFWGVSLNKQSERIYEQDRLEIRFSIDSTRQPDLYQKEVKDLEERRMRRRKQYLGEGGTFIVIIFIGAAVVYTSFRRSIMLSRQQNNFMLAVTHELKSPIAAVKLNLQTLQRHKLDEDKVAMLIDKSIKESSRLNDLCNNMLLASQMEGRQYKAAKEPLSFRDLVTQAYQDYDNRYPGRFITDITESEMTLIADRLMLQMAMNNLLENAVKYAPADKATLIKLFEKGGYVCLQVIDEGIGIPDDEKQKVFRKFYRVGNENTRRTKGTGLGLYLTRKIVLQHKGKISVRDNKPNGSCFEVLLPLA